MICYFGEFPKWFNFFLETCRYNDSVKFIIFSDSKKHYPTAQNVTYKKLSLHEFNWLASEKLNIAIRLLEPYKVCDFKPAFGAIFEDCLQGTDFWGHCDIDLVFGNIRSFITNEILDIYDIITARKEYLLGHFTLYRNEDKINRIYEQSKNYKFIFQSRELFSFDECNFLWWHLLAGYNILNIQSPVRACRMW